MQTAYFMPISAQVSSAMLLVLDSVAGEAVLASMTTLLSSGPGSVQCSADASAPSAIGHGMGLPTVPKISHCCSTDNFWVETRGYSSLKVNIPI